MKVIVYGEGGYDPSKLNNNIIEEYETLEEEANPLEVARISALDKLSKLGLTQVEIDALLNNN